MQRIFFFYVPELSYEKKDLNVPSSEKRFFIGKLSRLITNTIFLSHALREDILIRIIVKNPITHIIQIKTDTIRYLGPEERSLGSLLIKTEKSVFEKKTDSNINSEWFQPNPGLLVKITKNIYADFQEELRLPVIVLVPKVIESGSSENNFYQNFSEYLEFIKTNYQSIIIHYDLASNSFIPSKKFSYKHQTKEIVLTNPFDNLTLISLANILLDKKKKP